MSVMYEEEARCVCSHGEARHTANEVPRGRCEAMVDLSIPGIWPDRHIEGRCSCKRFQLKAEPV